MSRELRHSKLENKNSKVQVMLEAVIKNKKYETPDILSFELAPNGSFLLPRFEAGSHIDVHTTDGLVRQYSLYNDPEESDVYKIAVLKDPNSRGGSAGVHATFNINDTIKISEPRNLFPLNEASHRVVLFAGGIGITPLMSMASVLEKQGTDFELHYHCRSKSSTAFYDELRSASYSARVHFHFDDAPEDTDRSVNLALSQVGDNINLYTCGPNGFMDYIFTTARALGWKDNNLHKEVFGAGSVELDDNDRSFELTLVRSGISLHIPKDKTVLEVLEEACIDIEASCEQGICGACLTTVIEGAPDHRDQFLSDEEKEKNNQFTPCCSRALSKSLSIDL